MELSEVRFTVWQFVRLMVHLEDHAEGDAEAALLSAWSDVWARLDKDLARLSESDMDAYAEMMMEQEVVIEDATAPLIATAKTALQAVLVDMGNAIEAGGEKSLIDSLTFESRELVQLIKKLDA